MKCFCICSIQRKRKWDKKLGCSLKIKSQPTDFISTIQPDKMKNRMSWTCGPNFSSIQRLTNEKMQIYHDCSGDVREGTTSGATSGATELDDKSARIFGQPNCQTRSSSFSDATESTDKPDKNFGRPNPPTSLQPISVDRIQRQHHNVMPRTIESTNQLYATNLGRPRFETRRILLSVATESNDNTCNKQHGHSHLINQQRSNSNGHIFSKYKLIFNVLGKVAEIQKQTSV